MSPTAGVLFLNIQPLFFLLQYNWILLSLQNYYANRVINLNWVNKQQKQY